MKLSDRPTCTLSARIYQPHRLRASLVAGSRNVLDLLLVFDSEVEGKVGQFVNDEARCCPFPEFETEESRDRVEMTVVASPEPEDRLASLGKLFDPGSSSHCGGVLG